MIFTWMNYFHIAVPLEGKLLVKLLQTRLASFPLAPVREASDCSYLTDLYKTWYIWPRLFSLLSDKVKKKVWSICSNVLWFKHCMVNFNYILLIKVSKDYLNSIMFDFYPSLPSLPFPSWFIELKIGGQSFNRIIV